VKKSGFADPRWRRIALVVFITYSLAYLDRVNFGVAAAAGMAADLGITAAASSLLSALFFLSYFLFQIPGTIYAEKRSAKTLIFWCLIAWGALATLTGVVTNLRALMVVRFLLGMAEAAVMPALLVLLSNWFSRAERSRANALMILGNPITVAWMSVGSGYLAHAYGWRVMFWVEGIPSILWAAAWWGLIADRPAEAGWLDPEPAARLQSELAREQSALAPVRNYREAFASPVVGSLAILYFCWSAGIYGFVLWLPSILRRAGNLDMVATGWLSAVPYLVAAPAMLGASYWSDRAGNRKGFIWPFLLVAALAFFGSFSVAGSHIWLSYALVVVAAVGMYAPYGPFFAIMPEILPRNVAGGAMALINGCGALGGFLGTYVVGRISARVGGATMSFELMGSLLLVSGVIGALLPQGWLRAGSPAPVH
jgi:sugar phosphate permease